MYILWELYISLGGEKTHNSIFIIVQGLSQLIQALPGTNCFHNSTFTHNMWFSLLYLWIYRRPLNRSFLSEPQASVPVREPVFSFPGSAPCVHVIVRVDKEKHAPRLGAGRITGIRQAVGHRRLYSAPVGHWKALMRVVMGVRLGGHREDNAGCPPIYCQSERIRTALQAQWI